jgi:hypothetical protein
MLIRQNALAAGTMTFIWLLGVVFDNMVARLPGHKFELPAIVLVVFVVFVWVNKSIVRARKPWQRACVIALIAAALTGAWLPATILCAMQLHLLLGGTL